MTNCAGFGSLRQMLLCILCCISFTLSGCGGGKGDGSAKQGDGNLHVRLTMKTASVPKSTKAASPSGDICVDFGIEKIQVRIKNASDHTVAESKLLQCALRTATLSGIPAGSGYYLEVDALIGEQVLWFGNQSDIEVIAKHATPVEVEMTYQGESQAPVTATFNPGDGAANTPTDTEVTISFNNEMVTASLNENTILVTNGTDPVPGTVTYNPETREAAFQPDQDLSIRTTYTITVNRDVMDRTGQHIEEDLSSNFTTPTVWFVDLDRSASGAGNSWQEALGTIGEAVATAGEEDQIWVKQGTYQIEENIKIDKRVWLIGGFEGTETQRNQRDWMTRPTIVSANNAQCRCFYITADAIVDGFTLLGGYLLSGATDTGGAMYIDNASPRIKNCSFLGDSNRNVANMGGAIYINTGNPHILGCTFSNNRAKDNPNSDTASGAAIYNNGGGPTIAECIFKHNQVNAKWAKAGAIHNNAPNTNTSIKNCVFIANSSIGWDDPGYGESYGGAIFNQASKISIENCQFKRNRTECGLISVGGAIANDRGEADIVNTIFDTNHATSTLAFADAKGGAIYNSKGGLTILNCTFFANEAIEHSEEDDSYGGAIASYSVSPAVITNAILWRNKAGFGKQIHSSDDSPATISFSILDQYYPDGINNINKDPRLAADLHLRPDSPCIDAADDSTAFGLDMDGEKRPQGDRADMGADEFLDSNRNAMPDYWEIKYAVSDPTADDDGDGIQNLSEYNLGTNPKKAEIVLDADQQGNVAVNEDHHAADRRTIVGGDANHNAFVKFNVSGLTSAVTSVAIRLALAEYNSSTIPIHISLWDVSTTGATLASDIGDRSTRLQIHRDLGGGIRLGQMAVKQSDENGVIDIRLTSAGVDALNNARKGSGEFITGIADLEVLGSGYLLFSADTQDRIHQLVIIE